MARLSKPRKKKVLSVPFTPASKKNSLSNFLLVVLILFSIFILSTQYQTMDMPTFLMYILLCLALITVYIKKRYTFSLKVRKYFDMAGIGLVGVAALLFMYNTTQSFAS